MTEHPNGSASIREVYEIVQRIESQMNTRLLRIENRVAWIMGVFTTVTFLLSLGLGVVARSR